MKEDYLRQTTPTIDVGSPIYKEYQSKAQKARHAEKTADNMAIFYVDELEDLPPEKQAMLNALASGALASERQKADQAFGHGRDVTQKSGRAMYRSAYTHAFSKPDSIGGVGIRHRGSFSTTAVITPYSRQHPIPPQW